MFLCTCVYKISKFVHNTYIKILSEYKSKKMFVHTGFVNSYMVVTTNGNISNYLDEARKMTMHLGFVNLCATNFDYL